MSSTYSFNTVLYRNNIMTPWGFRLEGGKGYQSPLIIQRVFQGSPASGNLQRGDVILRVQNIETKNMHVQDVKDLIERSGGSLELTIKRGQPYPGGDGVSKAQSNHYKPVQEPYATPYHEPQQFYSMQQIQPLHQHHAHQKPHQHHAHQKSNTTEHFVSHFKITPKSPALYKHFTEPIVTLDNQKEQQTLVRNRVIEKPRDPKPILSQTGSPMLPGYGSLGSQKRYVTSNFNRTKSIPILETVQPIARQSFKYQEKQLANKIQDTLDRAVARARPVSSVETNRNSFYNEFTEQDDEEYTPIHVTDRIKAFQSFNKNSFPSEKRNFELLDIEADAFQAPWKGTLRSVHKHAAEPPKANVAQDDKSSQNIKIVNNQYNTPIGLYSKTNISEEMNRQFGDFAMLPSSDF